MIKDNNELLKLKLSKKKSNIITFYNSISESIYTLFCLILDEPIDNFWYECISNSFGYIQIICYILDTTVSILINKFLILIIIVSSNLESRLYNKRIIFLFKICSLNTFFKNKSNNIFSFYENNSIYYLFISIIYYYTSISN